ncbi:MAG TPA: hypothetical protein VF007_04190, partial [Stellaceae bacterium]
MTNNPNANANIVGSTALMDQPDSAAPNGDVAEWQALLTGSATPSVAASHAASANESTTPPPQGPGPTAEPQPISAASMLDATTAYPAQAPTVNDAGTASIAATLGVPAMIDLEPSSATQDPQALASALQEVVVGSGSGLVVDLFYDAAAQGAPQSFRDGVQAAAGLLASAVHDRISINIEVGYGEYNGAPLSDQSKSFGNIAYQGNNSFGIGESY